MAGLRNRKTGTEKAGKMGKTPVGRKAPGWKGKARRAAGCLAMCLLLALSTQAGACAAAQVTAGISNLQNIVASFVSAVGSIIVLWGIFEWGNAMQSQDGMMQSQAFKRIGGGIVMTLGPQLLALIVGA